MRRFFGFIILSDDNMSKSSLSGNFEIFIVSWCLIKRSLQTLETENNYTFTQRWGGWREKTNKPSKIKTKKAKKSSVFKSCDFSCRSKGRLDCDQTREKFTQRLFEHFFFFKSQIVFAWVRVFPNPEIYLQQMPGKKEKKRGEPAVFLAHVKVISHLSS